MMYQWTAEQRQADEKLTELFLVCLKKMDLSLIEWDDLIASDMVFRQYCIINDAMVHDFYKDIHTRWFGES